MVSCRKDELCQKVRVNTSYLNFNGMAFFRRVGLGINLTLNILIKLPFIVFSHFCITLKYVVSPSWKIQVLFKHLKCNCGSSCTYCSKSSEQFVLSYHSSLGKYPFKLQRRGNTIVHCIFPRCVSAILIVFEHLKCNYGSSVTLGCYFSIHLAHKIWKVCFLLS